MAKNVKSTPVITKESIVSGIADGSINTVDGLRQLEALSKSESTQLSFKVSEKGAVSIYGLQRMPVTLYKGQWIRLIESIPALEKFIKDNDSKLSQGRKVESTPNTTGKAE